MALRSLERRTSVTANPGLSIRRLSAIKLRVLAEFVTRRLLLGFVHYRVLRDTKRLAGQFGGQTAIVIANGPSTKKLNWQKVKEAQDSGLYVVALNYFPLSTEMEALCPDLLVLSDPAHRLSNVQNAKNLKMWEIICKNQHLRLAVPTSWFDDISSDENLASRVVYFNDLALEGWTRNINPLRPRGYISMTAYKAIALALHMGFSEVSIIGVDNTFFQTLEVDLENRVVQHPNHFFSEGGVRGDLSNFYPGGVAEYFRDVSMCFDSLARCFAGQPVVNLDPTSLVDCFPKRFNSPLVTHE